MRRNQLGLKASNVVLSTAVVGLFFLLLMLAMAQEQVLSSLSRAPGFRNYNSSLIDAGKADETAARIADLLDQQKSLAAAAAEHEQAAARATLVFTREAVRLAPIISRLDASKGCDILTKPVMPTEGMSARDLQIQAKEAELSSLRACLEFGQTVDDQQNLAHPRAIATAEQASTEPAAAQTRREAIAIRADAVAKELWREKNQQNFAHLRAIDRAEQASTELAVVQTRRKIIAIRTDAVAKELWREKEALKGVEGTRAHFRVLDALATPDWFPIHFVDFPPFIVHLLLTFFSGMFGALLITTVFLVYPSKLRERVSAKLYYRRIFLGGLVAVTVFIVLAGGASILGTSESAQTGTNFMSFAAIGLLAGMFSDKVADWLSARAKTMFSSDDDDDDDRKGDKDGQPDDERTRPA